MSEKTEIISIQRITHNVKKFRVKKPGGYEFVPGQATEVAIDAEKWIKEKHPFTFTSLNNDPFLEFIIKSFPVKKYPNHTGMTEKLHTLKLGDRLIIGKPWGAISYRGPGIFIAGGAGITPFIAIFKQLKKDNKLKGNILIFSNKKAKDIILENELKDLFGDKNLILTLTEEKKDEYLFGRINGRFLKGYVKDFSQRFYICGPVPMVKEISAVLRNFGAESNSLVFEK